MNTLIRHDFPIRHPAPPESDKHRSNAVSGKAAYGPRLPLKTERIGKKVYRTRAQAKADVFDYVECFYNPTRRHSTLGSLSPIDFEREAGVA